MTNSPNRLLGRHHGTPGWYVGPAVDHCRSVKFYIPVTGVIRVSDKLQYISKKMLPTTTAEDYLYQEFEDIFTILEPPPAILPFLLFGDAAKNAVINIYKLPHHRTQKLFIPILTLSPILSSTPIKSASIAASPVGLCNGAVKLGSLGVGILSRIGE